MYKDQKTHSIVAKDSTTHEKSSEEAKSIPKLETTKISTRMKKTPKPKEMINQTWKVATKVGTKKECLYGK